MSEFGKTLFSGSPFVTWTLIPVIVIFLIVMPFCIPEFTFTAVAILVVFWIMGVAMIVGMLNPKRFRLALRILCATVFLFYFAYTIDEFYQLKKNNWEFKPAKSKGEANVANAVGGLVAIGGPCLVFAIFGRFTRKKEEQEESSDI